MKDKKYNKKVNVRRLDRELKQAGFKIYGVSYDAGKNETIVHLADDEMRNPDITVQAHVYIKDKPIDYAGQFKNAKTTSEKLKILAKYVGMEKPTEKELDLGKII